MHSREHAEAFLRLLHPAPAVDSIVEFRLLGGSEPISLWHWDERCTALDRVLALNDRGFHTYIGVNPRRTMGGGRLENIAAVTVIPIDIDWAKTGLRPDSIDEIMRKVGLRPSVSVVSGGGAHFYLLLDRPYSIEETKPTIARVIHCFGGDRITKSPVQIMRLPGTTNWKDPASLCYLHEWTGHRYSIDEINAKLDAANAPALRLPAPPVSDVKPTAETADIVASLSSKWREVIEHGTAPTGWRDMSELDWVVVCKLIEAGATDRQISDIYASYPIRRLKFDRASNSYLERTVKRAREEVLAEYVEKTEIPAWVVDSKGLYYFESGRIRLNIEMARGLIDKKMHVCLDSPRIRAS